MAIFKVRPSMFTIPPPHSTATDLLQSRTGEMLQSFLVMMVRFAPEPLQHS